jgi:uncharacterized protein
MTPDPDPADGPFEAPQAPLPLMEADNAAFWRGGERGELLIGRCGHCGFYVHPPGPICPRCLHEEVRPEAVSGRATLASFTVNHQPWTATMKVPFVIGLAELVEQAGLRLTTDIVQTPLHRIRVGMPLQVVFEPRGDVWLPLFREASAP